MDEMKVAAAALEAVDDPLDPPFPTISSAVPMTSGRWEEGDDDDESWKKRVVGAFVSGSVVGVFASGSVVSENVGGGFVSDIFVGASVLGRVVIVVGVSVSMNAVDAFVSNSVVGDSVSDSVVGDSVVGDSVVGDSVVGDSVVVGASVSGSVVGDSVVVGASVSGSVSSIVVVAVDETMASSVVNLRQTTLGTSVVATSTSSKPRCLRTHGTSIGTWLQIP